MKSASAVVAFAALTSATSWNDFKGYTTPTNNNNQCDDQEKSGFSWGNLGIGSFGSYGGNNFDGFSCSNSFGKRDPLTKRTFGGKVIQGSMTAGKGPSMSCGSDKNFSPNQYQISVSKDTDVEFHYQMKDGTTCKHTASCKTGGTVVQNSQCGGAQQVSFQLPQGSNGGCDIGIHSIGFDCSPPPSSAPPPVPSSSKPASPPSSSVPKPPPASSTPVSPPPPLSSGPPVPPPASSEPPSPPPPSSLPPVPPPASSGPPVPPPASSQQPSPPGPSCIPGIYYGNSSFGGSCSSPPPPLPGSSTPVSPPPPVSSGPSPPPPPPVSSPPIINPPPVSSGPVPSPASSGPAPPPSSIPIPPPDNSKPVPPPAISSSTPVSPITSSRSAPPPPGPSANCPDVLPNCLNTWLFKSGCKDASDYTCFCKNSDFTKNVIDCVNSYGADTTEISKALSYMLGICAAYIPQNPGLITNCPSSIPITPPPAASTPVSPIQPGDTTVYTTAIVTATLSTCKEGETITDKGQTTILTAPTTLTKSLTSTLTLTTCGKCQGGGVAAPVTTSPPQWTVISIANTYTVPCTYSTGESWGFPIPGSSTITQLTTAVTVPQVQFTTAPPAAGMPQGAPPNVGLAQAPPPTPVAAQQGPPATGETSYSMPVGAIGGSATTFMPTGYGPSSTTTGGPLQVTANAGSSLEAGAAVGIAAGLFAVLMI